MNSQISNKSFPFNSFSFSLISLIIFLPFTCTQQSNLPIIHDTIYVNNSRPLIKLTVDSVKVDSFYDELTKDKMIDGIPAFINGKETNSRWAVEGYPHYAMFYFNGLVTVNKIRFNLFKGDQGITNQIKLYNFSDLIYEGDIGDSLWNTIHLNFYGSSIFLEVTGPSINLKGKTNNWTDIGEIEFYGHD
ncbi:MAG: hypothetical protein KDC90_02240 [Ignavibacteriae bacterium]|nr:hypothetical protein [Ignavibacteriota bacterium]